MKTKFLSPLNFIRDFTINLLAGIGVAVGINLWVGISMGIIVAIYLIFKRYERLIKIIWSGAQGYYYSFPPEENPNIWRKSHESIRYLGISSYTIFPAFKAGVDGLSSTLNFYFLLMSPEARALEKQLLHEKGITDSSQIKDELQAMRSRIRAVIDELKAMKIYKEGRLQIKLYDEFVPWWMYILDNEEIYLGFLPKGKPGIDSPLLVMKKVKSHTTLFDTFSATWDRMWEEAKKDES